MRYPMLAAATALLAFATLPGVSGASRGQSETTARNPALLLLAQNACPPGYHYEAEGYTSNGKYRPAHCAKD